MWKFPDGKTFVRGSTSSDKKADANNLSDLKMLLGIISENREGERRTKKTTNGRAEVFHYERSPNTSLADKLLTSGITATALQDKIDVLERQNGLLNEIQPCWFCRLKDWWRKNV